MRRNKSTVTRYVSGRCTAHIYHTKYSVCCYCCYTCRYFESNNFLPSPLVRSAVSIPHAPLLFFSRLYEYILYVCLLFGPTRGRFAPVCCRPSLGSASVSGRPRACKQLRPFLNKMMLSKMLNRVFVVLVSRRCPKRSLWYHMFSTIWWGWNHAALYTAIHCYIYIL